MEIKKFKLSVFAFLGVTVCGLRQPADRHETKLELGMIQSFWPNYFANFFANLFLRVFCLMRAQAVKMQNMVAQD